MSRTLPLRPDFTQLKHQAKDLLRAQAQKDDSVCDVLRKLNRFSTADNSEILENPVALHEAQYALAMDYGFSSWNALKRHVEKVTGRPSPLRREKGRTYVTGLEDHGIGCKDAHDNSLIAALAGVMKALGEEDLTYEYLMGASGAAFRVQMDSPQWCPSAACACPGYDCMTGAVAVTGYRVTWIDMMRGDKWLPEEVNRALKATGESIDRGIPVIAAGMETALVVGYLNENNLIMRPYEFTEESYRDVPVFAENGEPNWFFGDGSWGDWVWSAGIIEPEGVPMDRREAVINSLKLAVKLANTESFGNYKSGFAALEYWISGLLDDSKYAALTPQNWHPMALANGYCFASLWSARFNAEKYLRAVAADFEEPYRAKLLELAGIYKLMHETLAQTKPEYDCIWSLQPWNLKSPENWTRAIREKEARLLSETLALERQAISKMEAFLAEIEG